MRLGHTDPTLFDTWFKTFSMWGPRSRENREHQVKDFDTIKQKYSFMMILKLPVISLIETWISFIYWHMITFPVICISRQVNYFSCKRLWSDGVSWISLQHVLWSLRSPILNTFSARHTLQLHDHLCCAGIWQEGIIFLNISCNNIKSSKDYYYD